MSVLKNLQNLSDLEFYKCAEKLQDDITDFALRNFGLKRSPRSVNQIIKDIEEADQETINRIFAKYGRKRGAFGWNRQPNITDCRDFLPHPHR